MNSRSVKFVVSPAVGSVSAEYFVPESGKCIMTLAHGAERGWIIPLWWRWRRRLRSGDRHLRFNFPFTENKKGRPDTPAVAHQTIAAAITHAHQTFPAYAVCRGKSFGGG